MRRSIPSVTVIVLMFGFMLPATAGGGSWLDTPQESHQPGDDVTLVGYTGGGGWVGHGPWIASINPDPFEPTGFAPEDPSWVRVGEAVVEKTTLNGYLGYRVLLELTLPEDLEAGYYEVIVRNAAGTVPGDIIGGSLAVGVTPEPGPRSFEWPLDEPLIGELPDDAIISGPGFEVTVGELRRGSYPRGAAEFMLDPSVLPPTTTTSSTSTTSATTTTVVPTDPSLAAAVQVLTDLPASRPRLHGASSATAAGGRDRTEASGSSDPVTSTARWLLGSVLVALAVWWLAPRLRLPRHRRFPWS